MKMLPPSLISDEPPLHIINEGGKKLITYRSLNRLYTNSVLFHYIKNKVIFLNLYDIINHNRFG